MLLRHVAGPIYFTLMVDLQLHLNAVVFIVLADACGGRRLVVLVGSDWQVVIVEAWIEFFCVF